MGPRLQLQTSLQMDIRPFYLQFHVHGYDHDRDGGDDHGDDDDRDHGGDDGDRDAHDSHACVYEAYLKLQVLNDCVHVHDRDRDHVFHENGRENGHVSDRGYDHDRDDGHDHESGHVEPPECLLLHEQNQFQPMKQGLL